MSTLNTVSAAPKAANWASRAAASVGSMGRRSISVVGVGVSKVGSALASAWTALAKFFQAVARPVANFFASHGKKVGTASLIALAVAGIGYVAYKVLGKKSDV